MDSYQTFTRLVKDVFAPGIVEEKGDAPGITGVRSG